MRSHKLNHILNQIASIVKTNSLTMIWLQIFVFIALQHM